MPLSLADIGEEYVIQRITGRPDMKKHLEDLGFTPGSRLRVVSVMGGNRIVQIRESRIAIDQALAQKIYV